MPDIEHAHLPLLSLLHTAYGQTSNAAKAVATQLRETLSRAAAKCSAADPGLPPLKPAPVVGILCPSGIEFFLHAIAVWYLGCALLPIAIGTTEDGVRNLLEKTGACALMAHSSQQSLAEKSIPDSTAIVPTLSRQSLDDLIGKDNHAATTLEPIATPTPGSSIIIFHSSGSTGLPKPIYHIHRFWTFSLATAAGTDVAAYTTTPLYHGGMSDFLRSLQAGSSIFFHPITGASNTLSIEHVLAGCEASQQTTRTSIGYFLSVPFVLEMMSKEWRGLEYLAQMDLVSTGGAPLPETVGATLVQADVHLVSRLGSSECGFLMSSFRDYANDKDWSWLRIDDPLAQEWIDFREDKDNPGLFELVVTGKWPTKLLSNTPDAAFSTQDLYSRHPDHATWYRYATRVDDTLVLLNGKKFAAGLIETKLRMSAVVEDAIVFGSNRALVGAIVVPPSEQRQEVATAEHKAELVQRLQPHLEQLNESLPSHARLTPELIIVADAQLAASIPRSSKGTLQRGHAYRQLNGLFDELYQKYEDGAVEGFPANRRLEGDELRRALSDLVARTLGVPPSEMTPTLDFYRAGMDSIGAVRIKAGVHQTVDLGVESSGEPRRLSTNDVYENPNVEALARFIERSGGGGEGAQPPSASEKMSEMVKRYAEKLPAYVARTSKEGHGRTVVLTGATGALGSHLLSSLLFESSTDDVVCLVRASSDEHARKRVADSLSARKLHLGDGDWQRVKCFAADLSRADGGDLGLSREFWTTIHDSSHLAVIHAAWTVNFALSLSSFEADNVRALSNLLAMALQQGASSFVFCSSLASVLSSGNREATIREEASRDPATAGRVGYSQSKWVAEALCAACPSELGVRIARIGQLCSDTAHGVWNETEAWPLLIRTGSAKETGVLPRIQQQLDWLPVDVAARSLVDLSRVTTTTMATAAPAFFHVCLPTDALRDVPTWDHLLEWLHSTGWNSYETVSLDEWLAALRKHSSAIRGRSLIEGIWSNLQKPITDGEVSGPQVETVAARTASASLADARPMDAELVRRTVEHWKGSGFL